jgi:hypothetical protein
MKSGAYVVISSLRVSVDRLMDGIMTVTCAKGAGELCPDNALCTGIAPDDVVVGD